MAPEGCHLPWGETAVMWLFQGYSHSCNNSPSYSVSNPHKLIALPNHTLVECLLRSVTTALSGVNACLFIFPQGNLT